MHHSKNKNKKSLSNEQQQEPQQYSNQPENFTEIFNQRFFGLIQNNLQY